MNMTSLWKRPMLGLVALALVSGAAPVLAQKAAAPNVDAETRIKKLEAEIKALQRQVFPGSNGKVFTPEIEQNTAAAAPSGTPATTPLTDLLTRMDAVEAQLARLTAQSEEGTNRIAQIEAKLAALNAAANPAPEGAASGAPAEAQPGAAAPAIAAGGAPATTTPVAVTPAPQTTAPPLPQPEPVVTRPAPAPEPVVEKPKPVVSKPTVAAKPVPPTAQRVAAVKAIEKPVSQDPAEDEYSYGYRLWEAKFYPEAQQQLQLYVAKYPNHARISYGRNLLGRTYLEDGKPREAAQWFLKNYQTDKKGARASDSLLYLAESMRQLKDTQRACIALDEFAQSFPSDAAGRLKSTYQATRTGVKCN